MHIIFLPARRVAVVALREHDAVKRGGKRQVHRHTRFLTAHVQI